MLITFINRLRRCSLWVLYSHTRNNPEFQTVPPQYSRITKYKLLPALQLASRQATFNHAFSLRVHSHMSSYNSSYQFHMYVNKSMI